jgi:UDP-glucose 4-epimerase
MAATRPGYEAETGPKTKERHVRIVITGASGNIGSALVERLAGGDHDLVGIARRPPEQGTDLADLVEWHSADLAEPASSHALERAVQHADAVVHLAWGFQPSHRLDLLEALGVGGTQRVLDAVATAGVPHLVHMSSVGAYSPKRSDAPVDEDYPTEGVPRSPYSKHKAAAERLLDRFEQTGPEVRITRLRPGIVGRRSSGSALLRYGVPGLIPAKALEHIPVLPLDPGIRIPMVHTEDVASAIALALESREPGAFNLAAAPDVTAHEIAAALGARLVPVPAGVLRFGVSAGWHARLLQLDPGWVDLAKRVPLLDTGRARAELGWSPTRTGPEVLREVITGMADAAYGDSPVLRNRTVAEQVGRAFRRGPVAHRREP